MFSLSKAKFWHLADDVTDICITAVQRVNIILNDSGIGKTFLTKRITAIQDQNRLKDISPEILVVNNFALLESIKISSCPLVIIDKMEQYSFHEEVAACINENPDKIFIIFYRGNERIGINPGGLIKLCVEQEGGKMSFKIS